MVKVDTHTNPGQLQQHKGCREVRNTLVMEVFPHADPCVLLHKYRFSFADRGIY